jgi:hypothetical protein
MIKGRSPFPFETIVLAVSFSPGLNSLISEMQRLCFLHKATGVFIHVGKKTSEKQRELSLLLSTNGFHDGNSRIYWEQGDIIPSILRICKHEVADLVILGASEKANFALPAGPNATAIATRAKCSVLIYTSPPGGNMKKIVVNGTENRKTDLTLNTSIYFAEKENSAELIIIEDSIESSYADSSTNFEMQATQRSSTSRKVISDSKVPVKIVSLVNEGCLSVSEYAFKSSADLIITHSSDHHLLIFDRISNGNGIEAILNDLSCNLFIVHSRVTE